LLSEQRAEIDGPSATDLLRNLALKFSGSLREIFLSIVVSIRVNDGIVLAADSATSFVDTTTGNVVKVYNNANKVFNLVKVWPIGAMTYGSGSIGAASISTLSKDLRERLTPKNNDEGYILDEKGYTIEEVAKKAKRFFFDEHFRQEYPDGVPNYFMGYRVYGYSAGSTLPEGWEIRIIGDRCEGPDRLYEDEHFGPRWAGETEALDRLVLGLGSRTVEALTQMGLAPEIAQQTARQLAERLYAPLFLPAMPIQDAIDLAYFFADTAARFTQFSLRATTVGGPIEVATITKHEGFKWVTRKHYYTAEFNRES